MTIESFDITVVAGKSTLWVDSNRIKECLQRYRDGGIESLGVNPQRGYSLRDLSFLAEYTDIGGLVVVHPVGGDFDLAPLLELESLNSLTISGPITLPVARFPKLRVLRGNWHPTLTLSGCQSLEVLDLSGYRSAQKDLTGLPSMSALGELSVTSSNIVNTNGIERLGQLVSLELAYLPQLRRLDGIETLVALKALTLEHCKKCDVVEKVSGLGGLEVLSVISSGELASVSFVANMPHLEEFRFVGTNVRDGDLTPLLRLKRVHFLPKRHYSHTPEQLRQAIDGRVVRTGGG
ncbi:MAG: hypothetical protein K8W52_33795 [Deltaproteobacteria bacterium]|nr:hypothetical protein [Deltaproteobacteria bacterium]